MAEVKFITPQGTEITRDIQSAEQISGFEKSGFKTVSNPFSTSSQQPTTNPSATTPSVDTFMSSREQERKQQEQQKAVEQKTQTESEIAGQAYKKGLEEDNRLRALEIENYTNQFDQLSLASKQQNEALINSIRNTYANRINQMEIVNKGALGAVNTAQIRSGRARYAPELATGMVSAEERAGIRRISDLDAEMNSQIAQAQQAATAKDFERLNTRMETINKLREQQTGALKEQYALAKDFEDRANEKAKSNLEMQKAQQEILEGNLELYSSALIGYDEAGNLQQASEEEINSLAEELGVPPALIKTRMSQQISELSKLSQEEYKRELDIMNAERQMIPQAFQEYEYAKNTLGYSGDFFEYLAQKEQVETSMPMSYKEWQLAGAPGEFANWLKSSETAPPKQFQYNAANYATRAEASNEIITGLESQFTGVKSYVGQVLPNFLKSSERQQLEQAQRNFVNAVLRRESGAVISDSEFNNAAKQYFPQPGDSIEVLEQKKANRELVVRNFINEAGSAIADTSPDLLNKYMQKATTYTDVLDFGTRATQQELTEFNQLKDLFPDKTPEEVFDFYQNESFNQPLSMGVKSSDVSKIKDGSRVTTTLGSGIATGIQQGSSKWKWGFDFVLAGGKGASVPAPFNGTVTFAGKNKGFGNQVKIKLADGREIWLSHLDAVNVKPGQKITKGMVIGKQGNTGALLSGSGQELTPQQIASGRGTHIDITVKKPSGGYLTSKEVASLLGTRLNQA